MREILGFLKIIVLLICCGFIFSNINFGLVFGVIIVNSIFIYVFWFKVYYVVIMSIKLECFKEMWVIRDELLEKELFILEVKLY